MRSLHVTFANSDSVEAIRRKEVMSFQCPLPHSSALPGPGSALNEVQRYLYAHHSNLRCPMSNLIFYQIQNSRRAIWRKRYRSQKLRVSHSLLAQAYVSCESTDSSNELICSQLSLPLTLADTHLRRMDSNVEWSIANSLVGVASGRTSLEAKAPLNP